MCLSLVVVVVGIVDIYLWFIFQTNKISLQCTKKKRRKKKKRNSQQIIVCLSLLLVVVGIVDNCRVFVVVVGRYR